MDFRVSYAQNREDFLIAAFFADVEVGHYVDVGAADPSEYSVTRHFYERGWSGINIEPIAPLAGRLRAARPRDVTIQAALGATAGQAEFREYVGSGLSTTSAEIKARHAEQGTAETEEFADYSVEVTTLASVLHDHRLPHIHFLKVDVEGGEHDVLQGNDWDEFRPELICIETDHMVRDWTPLLETARYSRVFHDGLNAYYLAAESMHRSDTFSYPQAVFSSPRIVTSDVADELAAIATIRDAHAARANQLMAQLSAVETAFAEVLASRSWRITLPLRRFGTWGRAKVPLGFGRRVQGWLRRRKQARAKPTNGAVSRDGQTALDTLNAMVDQQESR